MAPQNNVPGAKRKEDGRQDAPGNRGGAVSTQLLDVLLFLSIPGLILAHLLAAPYTKVEESFNMQAAHDVLVFGTPTSDIHRKLSATYDHFTFPGAVPRTFIGPVLLAGLSQPIVALVGFQHAQLVVRAILGLFNAASLLVFSRNLRRAYGAGTARWYLLLQASQFHVLFYASRTLPNMFAFGLTTLAFAFLLPQPTNPKSTRRRQRLSITLFVFAAAVFRSEVALLLAITVLYLLIIPEISLERVIFPFAVSFLTALATSIPIDSYFWQRPLWPELWAFYYNVVLGSASAWGVSPWHYYFTSALPRLLVNPLAYAVLIPFALWHPALRRVSAKLVVGPLLFTAIYSLQPHKETRFIFYAIPPLTAAAALAANFLFTRGFGAGRGKEGGKKSPLATLLAALLVLSVAASFLASSAMLALSALNYPGGEALAHLRSIVAEPPTSNPLDTNEPDTPPPSSLTTAHLIPIHADVLACMTGVTRFGAASDLSSAALSSSFSSSTSGKGSSNPHPILWGDEHSHGDATVPPHQHHTSAGARSAPALLVDKTEDPALLRTPAFWRQFAYLLVEDPQEVIADNSRDDEWETVGVVQAYGGIELVRPGQHDHDDGEGKGGDGKERASPVLVGSGRTVALWKRRVRALTGGWWVGPRMVERIYILRRRAAKEAVGRGVAVEAR